MKWFNVIFLALFLSTSAFALDTVITTDKVVSGQKSSTAVKSFEFQNSLSPNNAAVTSLPASNDLTLKSNLVKAGAGTAANQQILWNTTASSKPGFQWNQSTSQTQVTNDGTNFYDVQAIKGSGDYIHNCSIAASVGSNALTVALKTSAGTDPSSADPCIIGYRNATLASGDITLVKTTSALSMVVSSGSTLGQQSAVEGEIFVGAMNNAGATELFVSTMPLDESARITTTAEGGAGAADGGSTQYSTTARTNLPYRIVGKMLSTQTTAGTWAAVPTTILSGGISKIGKAGTINQQVYVYAGNGYGSTNTKIRRYTNTSSTATDMTYADSATAGMSITINKWGVYFMTRCDASSGTNLDVGISLNSNQLTINVSTITAANRVAIWEMPTITVSASNSSGSSAGCVSAVRYLAPGDVIRAHDNAQATDAGVYSWFLMTRVN